MYPYPYSGPEFRAAREKGGLSVVQLAAQSHMFVYEIQHLESGQKVPPNKYPRVQAVLQPWLPVLKQA